MFSEKAKKCPKCKTTYREDQRFCLADGARLLPEAQIDEVPNIFAAVEKSAQLEKENLAETVVSGLASQQKGASGILVWKDGESVIESRSFSNLITDESNQVQEKKNAGKRVNPFSIPSGTVEPGDRSIKPLGREAFNPEKPRLMLGKTLKGRYEILNFVKRTPKFCVYLANDLVAERSGTEKKTLVYIFAQKDSDEVRRFLGEERVSFSHTKHPNIAIMIDSGRLQEGNSFMVLEFPDGKSLEKKLSEEGHIETNRVAKIIYQAAEALNEAHRNNVLHRSLTPQKIVLTSNEKGSEQVKVIEFAVSEGEVTQENFLYLAPEQLAGKGATSSSDIFSLGVIAYQLLTKRLPFETSSIENLQKLQEKGLKVKPSQLRADVATTVDEVLQKALSFDPSQRYLRARDFGDAFYNALVKKSEEETVALTSRVSSKTATENKLPTEKKSTKTLKSELKENKTKKLAWLILALLMFLVVLAIFLL